MAGELRITTVPELRSPVLVAAFRGWNDGAHGATLAVEYLSRMWHAERFADIDPEEFFDFQSTRPHVSLVDGVTRKIDWPETSFLHARPAGLDRDVVLMVGVEPNLRWRRFSSLVVDVARQLRVELVVTLGALLADVPHTRPVPVTGEPEPLDEVGIVGVLHDAFRQADIPSASLWAAVPHYVSLTPSPRAAEALCSRLGELLGVELELTELAE